MAIASYNDDDDEVPERTKPEGGIYELPVVGDYAFAARGFFDAMTPAEDDSTKDRVAKNVIRYSAFGAGSAVTTAALALVVL